MENAGVFSRLPAELRNSIYEFALCEEDAIRLGPNIDSCHLGPTVSRIVKQAYKHTMKVQSAPPALTRTCRAIRQESIPIFYSVNMFVLPETPVAGAARWLVELLGERCRMMAQLYVCPMHETLWVMELRAEASLERAIVNVKGEGLEEDEGLEMIKVTFR